MTAIAVREENIDLDVRQPEPPQMMATRLTQWAYDARQANQVARSLAITAFVPQSLRGRHQDQEKADQITISQITAAILAGQEVGLEPMAALRSIDIIEGTPGMRAQALRGVVQSHGHDVWVEESTATRAVVCGQRRGSEKIQKSVWTIDRAKQMGLTGKANWTKQPTAMLVARATSEVCRWVGGDAILGMPYSAEELSDGIDAPEEGADAAGEASAPAAKGRAKRRTPVDVPPVAEPTIDQPADDVPLVGDHDDATPVSAIPVSPAPAGPARADEALVKRMQATLTEAGYASSDERREYIVRVIGRSLDTMKDLTVGEAEQVIRRVTEPPAGPDYSDDSLPGGAA